MSNNGFNQSISTPTCHEFINHQSDICIVIDYEICSDAHLRYVDYTSHQNALVHRHDKVYRFLLDPDNSAALKQEITFFLDEDPDPESVACFGRNRTEQDIDPSLPEAVFEDCFIEAFGEAKLHCIHREYSYIDCEGKRRFIDYAVLGKQKIAIELNGETFHHPCSIGSARYRSQLFKQNSLVHDGFKVYRWSLYGMQDREKFIQELQLFFGDPSEFLPNIWLKSQRQGGVQTISLHEHQGKGLELLEKQRHAGQRTFLIVLPTGTGKTEIFIEDIVRLKTIDPQLKVLVTVPTRHLRSQTIDRFMMRAPQFDKVLSTDLFSNDGREIFVQTYASLHRTYQSLPPDNFDYIVVDEAHHAVAQGLRQVLEHFSPSHLLGFTATPERFDQKKLEEIFGEYESILSLEDAIRAGHVPPVRCFRVSSNIDLSEVRFNGRDYVKSDLQRSLQIPSRDQFIVETLLKYFSGRFSDKQGVVFCVDIDHAQRMAKLLVSQGITASAVSGRDRTQAETAQDEYRQGTVRFLCACDLLTEGWDAPQTSILVMARPTFSQVLYIQQLGRGLRHYPAKEALYVIDVVDNYGARLQPMSLHALFGIAHYRPFDDVIKIDAANPQSEIVVLNGLYEGERRVEPVNIFNFEKIYGDYLNEEQLARELFVSTGTVRSWLQKGDIKADAEYPFGRRQLAFFNPAQVPEIRRIKKLTEHTEETRKVDFFGLLEQRDYTFSFKIIFLLAFLKTVNDRGEASLPELLSAYRAFYQGLLDKYGKNDRANCPYNKHEVLADEAEMQRSLLRNPFEKFERKRFFYHCDDLNYIAIDRILFDQLTAEDYAKIRKQMVADLHKYFLDLQIIVTENDYKFLLPDEKTPPVQGKVIFLDNFRDEDKFKTVLPFYELSIAAGQFLESETPPVPSGWIDVSDLSHRKGFDDSMFVSLIQGKSMEPIIPDGSYCLFTRRTGGTRNGKIVLAQKLGLSDIDTGGSYTIKRYESSKIPDESSEWLHESIVLKAANHDYEDIEIIPEESDQFSIVAIYLETLG